MGFTQTRNEDSKTAHPRLRRDPIGPDDVLSLLADPEAAERLRGAQIARSIGMSSAVLIGALADEADSQVREAIVLTLCEYDDATLAAGLRSLLHHRNASQRAAAVRVLARQVKEDGRLVRDLYLDSDPDIRLHALQIMQESGSPLERAWLLHNIEREPVANVVGALLDQVISRRINFDAEIAGSTRERFPEDPFIAFALHAWENAADPS